jgi:hypothetical protein
MYNALWRSTEAVEFARAVERAHGIVDPPRRRSPLYRDGSSGVHNLPPPHRSAA